MEDFTSSVEDRVEANGAIVAWSMFFYALGALAVFLIIIFLVKGIEFWYGLLISNAVISFAIGAVLHGIAAIEKYVRLIFELLRRNRLESLRDKAAGR